MSRPKRGRGTGAERPSWTNNGPTEPGEAPGFTCAHCGRFVPDRSHGTSQRNHCPYCLWSVHVDIKPGDRASLCRAPMEPVALWACEGDELRILHRCTGCGVIKPNRVAGDDSEEALDELVERLVRARRSEPAT
ncbi:MAG: RNHCP domain-containing protein [Spirochaetota bacterium]